MLWIILAVLWILGAFLAWSLCRIAAEADRRMGE